VPRIVRAGRMQCNSLRYSYRVSQALMLVHLGSETGALLLWGSRGPDPPLFVGAGVHMYMDPRHFLLLKDTFLKLKQLHDFLCFGGTVI
jgi:hypothetical protein